MPLLDLYTTYYLTHINHYSIYIYWSTYHFKSVEKYIKVKTFIAVKFQTALPLSSLLNEDQWGPMRKTKSSCKWYNIMPTGLKEKKGYVKIVARCFQFKSFWVWRRTHHCRDFAITSKLGKCKGLKTLSWKQSGKISSQCWKTPPSKSQL